ncbi:MAG: amino acid adenylation domain-containing protein, partial [Myxococcota bacterium]
VVFAKDYHGNFDEVLVRKVGRRGAPKTLPLAPGIPRSSVENVVVLDYGTEESAAWIAAHADELAAVVVEPMQSRRPDFVPRAFIREVRRITEEQGVCFIFDEVITGFRSHPGGAQAIYGIRADLATYGKVIGGGMPIGVVAGRREYMDTFDGGHWRYGDDSYPESGVTFFAGTFVRHPLAIAAANASLRHFRERGPALQEELNRRTDSLTSRINALFEQNDLAISMPHFASQMFIRVEESDDLAMLLFYHLRFRGIHVLEGFPSYLTTAHTEADLDAIVAAFEGSIADMQEGGIFAPVRSPANGERDDEPGRRIPLTEAQTDIFVASSLGPEASCAYNESDTVELIGAVDTAKLREATQRVLLRHQALHVTFDEGGEFQTTAGPVRVEVPILDLTDLGAADKSRRLREILDDNAATPFDLMGGPLVRVRIIALESERHWFLLAAHHIVIDGWSSSVLVGEIAHVYSALVEGQRYELPVPTAFADFARAAERHSHSEAGHAALAYWKKQFETLPPVSNLPSDRPRPEVKGFAGNTVKWTLDEAVYLAIKKSAAQHNLSLFSFLLGAYEVLLARISNETDFVVGVSIAGQASFDGASLVGHCVNLVPMRATFDPERSFADSAKSVQRRLLDAQEHRSTSLGRLLRELRVPRSAARMPLVEVMFNFSTDRSSLSFGGAQARRRENPRRYVNVDLFANVLETSGALTVDWDYNAEIFDEETVRRWIRHYETLLASAASDIARPVRDLEMLAAEDRALLARPNSPPRAIPMATATEMLTTSLTEHAARRAIRCVGETPGDDLTYGQLDVEATRLAHYLRAQGVGQDVLVGVCLERSPRLLVALLAVWKAGGAYVPLDPSFPVSRLAHIVADAGLGVLVQEAATRDVVGEPPAIVVDLDVVGHDEVDPLPPPLRSAKSLAYVLYTSGSTGEPKGVAIEQGAVANLFVSMAEEPGLDRDDVLAAVTTISFDISVLELFLPLVVGAQVAVVDPYTAADGQELAEALEEAGATVMQATPSTWRLLFEDGWEGRAQLRAWCGGEALPRDLGGRLLTAVGELWNVYGPTETTVWSTCHRVIAESAPIVVGRPIANTQLYVVDDDGRVAAPGVVGELCIAGAGLARGYWDKPALTAERFVHLDIGEKGPVRVYRTGDLARFRPVEGAFEVLGRRDDQVKVRGYRIELGDIETALAAHPAVRQAVAVVQPRSTADTRLLGFF